MRNVSGRLAPGNSPGVMVIAGNYTQLPTGTLEIEIGGPAIGQFDRLEVNPPGGNVSLDGALDLKLFGG